MGTCEHGDPDSIPELIKYGADVTLKNIYGDTVLDIARKNGHSQDTIDLLERQL